MTGKPLRENCRDIIVRGASFGLRKSSASELRVKTKLFEKWHRWSNCIKKLHKSPLPQPYELPSGEKVLGVSTGC